jgi:hypothetical protein
MCFKGILTTEGLEVMDKVETSDERIQTKLEKLLETNGKGNSDDGEGRPFWVFI